MSLINNDLIIPFTIDDRPDEKLIEPLPRRLRPSPAWSFELADSKTLRKLGELTQARNRSLQLALNRGGAWSMGLPLDDAMAGKVQEVSTCTIVKFKGQWIWSGPVWNTEETTPNQFPVSCVGWLQTLEKRLTKPTWGDDLVYNGVDAGEIAQALLRRSNEDSDFPETNYVQPGFVQSTQTRVQTYSPFNSVLGEMTNLSDLESGYDMLVDPRSRKLNIYRRIGVPRPKVVFEYGGAASSASRVCDISRLVNRFIAYSSAGWAQADDLISQREFGVFEEAVSLSDVTDIAILQAFANAELAVRSRPLKFHSFGPRKHSSARPSDPRLFEDFNIGDTVYLKVNRGRLQIKKQAVRVFGATIAFDEDGNEHLTSVQTTATS